ncbi:MAG TPA: carboxypeptidase-like regulatory domain-containing protein, partial [Pyrinomonadaceae bacterium]
TAGVTILNATTTYPNIAPNANANRLGFNLVAKAPPTSPCGTRLNFTLTITSSLGTVARNFSLRMGQASGTLAPVTYTRTIAPALAIPDGIGSGAIDTLNVPDDYQIADVNVRVDSLTHTYDGDLTAGIRGPNGYGTDLIALTGWESGGVFLNFGSSGDNFTNTVIDDEAANGLVTATTAQAPYTGSWKPSFNSPGWVDLIGANPDAVPELAAFDGTSSLGQWKMVVSDWATPDTGTLSGWSLIITPQNFVCTSFTPTAAAVGISGTVTDAGGRAIYRATVSLTDSQGNVRNARTNPFGYFRFDEVPSGETYLIGASAKGYNFEPQVVSVIDEVAGFNLVAQE